MKKPVSSTAGVSPFGLARAEEMFFRAFPFSGLLREPDRTGRASTNDTSFAGQKTHNAIKTAAQDRPR